VTRRTAGAAGLSIAALLAAWLVQSSLHSPPREVRASQFYRSGQLDPDTLRDAVAEHGVRSILNLRGAAPGSAWYEAERREADALGVQHVDLRLSADRLPSRAEIGRLIGLLDGLERPILFHCLGGRDRSGLAEALVILHAGGSLHDARRAMRIFLAAFPVGRSDLDQYIDQYEAWLERNGLIHTGELAREYGLVHYVPEPYSGNVEMIAFPEAFVAGEPYAARFRVENRSAEPWQLTRRGSDRGVNLGLRVERLAPTPIPACEGRAATPEGTLGPAEKLELAMNLPILEEAGTYRLRFDLVNETVAWFADRGGTEAIVREIRVEPRPALQPRREPGDDFVACDLP
jgi:protein tyrosine phosphatase (PTP) superfamily phosphohydrolase (DUF442 family)